MFCCQIFACQSGAAVSISYVGQAETVAVVADDNLPSLRNACCWQLDVEDHELAVLAGAARTLAEAPPAAFLCEARSPAVQRTLSAAGGNQLWPRYLSWAQERLQTAPAFSLLGERI